MVDIAPFQGILYNPEKIKSLKDVVTPPYDVITPDQQESFYGRNEYNVIRLDLGKDAPQDGPQNNKYTRADDFFKKWRKDKILNQDPDPAFYRYEVRYEISSGDEADPSGTATDAQVQKTLKGFFAAVRLEPFSSGNILPHEDTFPKVKEDRLNLLRAARANFSPIMMLYSDPDKTIQGLLESKGPGASPRLDFSHEDGTRQTLWSVDDSGMTGKIRAMLASRTLLIADGHHRYETALNFSRECAEGERMMMLLVNMDDTGLSLLPIHRVIRGLPAEQIRALIDSLERYYDVDRGVKDLPQLRQRMRKAASRASVLGMYTGQGEHLLLTLKAQARDRVLRDSKIAPELAGLDVSIFDQLVLEDLLAFKGGAADRGTHVVYIKDPKDGVDMITRGEAQAAFFLNPIGIGVVQDLAGKGIKMPHKSTYFYPKPLSGLVLRALPDPGARS